VDWSAKPEIYKEYQMLIGLYNEHPALRKGKMTAWPDNDVLVFEKADDAERYLILVNVRNEQKTVKIPEEWKKLGEALTLEPFEYCIEKY
jgi:glycosidase